MYFRGAFPNSFNRCSLDRLQGKIGRYYFLTDNFLRLNYYFIEFFHSIYSTFSFYIKYLQTTFIVTFQIGLFYFNSIIFRIKYSYPISRGYRTFQKGQVLQTWGVSLSTFVSPILIYFQLLPDKFVSLEGYLSTRYLHAKRLTMQVKGFTKLDSGLKCCRVFKFLAGNTVLLLLRIL